MLSLFKPMESAVLKQCYKCYNGTRHTITTSVGVSLKILEKTQKDRSTC